MKYLTIYIASILVGCATVPRIWINAYEGAELPDKRIAKLHVTSHNYGDELRIDGIDYPMRTNLNDFWKTVVTNKFKLTPGEHEIYYSLHWFKLGFVQGTFLVSSPP